MNLTPPLYQQAHYFDHMLEGVQIVDFEHRYLYVNDVAVKQNKFSREKLLGRTQSEMYPGMENTDIYAKISRCLTTRESQYSENDFTFPDGSIGWYEIRISPIAEGALIFSLDVTERKRAQNLLLSSAKMSALGEMSCGIAHEISSPLTVIMALLPMIIRKVEIDQIDKDTLIEKLNSISSATDKITTILAGLKTLARNGENDPLVNINLKKVIDDTIVLCQERFNRHKVALRLKINNILDVQVRARETQLGQVLINLLNNAVDAVAQLQEKWVDLEIGTNSDQLQIFITDSGNGIPKEIVAKMMEPFFTTKPVGKGTGLGLSITKGIIEQFQGRFYYDENHPHTRFVIELPLEQTHL